MAAVALSGSLASARPAAANTWAGVWNSDFGQLTLDAGGSGSYTGFNPGTVTGSVTGDIDKGTWNQPGNPPKSGPFEFTLSPDGHSFSGTWAYAGGGCGSACGWNGTCLSGACLKNGQSRVVAPVGLKLTYSVNPAESPGPGRVFVGAEVTLEAEVTGLTAGQAVVITVLPKGERGRGTTVRTCRATRICTYGFKSTALGVWEFRAFVLEPGGGVGGTDVVEETPVLEIAWVEPQMSLSLQVKASNAAPLASSARVPAAQFVLLVAEARPELAPGAQIAIAGRPSNRPAGGTQSGMRICGRSPCEVGKRPGQPGTWYFQAWIFRGNWGKPGVKILAKSPPIAVTWGA